MDEEGEDRVGQCTPMPSARETSQVSHQMKKEPFSWHRYHVGRLNAMLIMVAMTSSSIICNAARTEALSHIALV